MKFYDYSQIINYIENNETTEIIVSKRLKSYYVLCVKEGNKLDETYSEKIILKGVIVAHDKEEAFFIIDKIAKKRKLLAYKFIDKPSEFKPLNYKSKQRLYIKEMITCENVRLYGDDYDEEK